MRQLKQLPFAANKLHFQLYIRDKILVETHMHALYTVNHIALLRLHDPSLSKVDVSPFSLLPLVVCSCRAVLGTGPSEHAKPPQQFPWQLPFLATLTMEV
ncbi:unnamed protein product [Sphenostylis stenocarpa]|uniref:Uncharacterized protein n=1 Tax=Sphenostylis stenocarpa TaxID=92480 RepID=A0AA86TLR4_9FABA|nr:unnamed protein product [Sphenostylis stenocarpa]